MKPMNTYEEEVASSMEDMFKKGWEAARLHPNAKGVEIDVTFAQKGDVATPILAWTAIYK